MSGGYVEDYGKVYGCFHCGEIMGEFAISTDGFYFCKRCDEPSIVTLESALDTMIKLQRDGHIFKTSYYDEEDSEIEIDPEDELDFGDTDD